MHKLLIFKEGCSCAAQLHHVTKWRIRFAQEVVKNIMKIHYSFHQSDQKHLFKTNFCGWVKYIFLLDTSKSGKNQLRGQCKIFYSFFPNKHTWNSLKCVIPNNLSLNHPSHFKSFYVVQTFQRCTNYSTQYKSFNAAKIIYCCTNLSTQYKSFNVV